MARGTNDSLIIDYLLGWMSARQRRSMDRRVESDPALRASVETWQSSLDPLAGLAAPVLPPDGDWAGVQAKLNAADAASPKIVRNWMWAVPGGVVVAVVVAFMVWVPKPSNRAYLGEAAAPERAIVVAEAYPDDTLVLRNQGLPAIAPDKSLELWIIPAGGTPRSLGLLPEEKTYRLHVRSMPPHATLAISVEPRGGSSSGMPTGPVILSGELRQF